MKALSISLLAAVALTGSSRGVRAQSLTFRTLAGSTNAGSTNGFGSNARFQYPAGVTAAADGTVFVADTQNHTLRKITPDGLSTTLAGSATNSGSVDGAGANARFYAPQGVSVDTNGDVYLADTANSTIRKITSSGLVSTMAGSPGVNNSFDGFGASGQFYHPESVAAGSDGNLYVADTWNHTIRVVTSHRVVSTLAGLAGNFGSADGTNSKARFNRPAGIAVDTNLNVYVADSLNHTIRKITSSGLVTTLAGMPGVWGSADGTNSGARFYLPQGISIAADGSLLVTDSGNQLLRKLTPQGTNWLVTTVAGSAGVAGAQNGNGTNALFTFPSAVAFDGAGQAYVADEGDNLVRSTRVTAPTLLSGFGGNPTAIYWPLSAEGFFLEQSPTFGAGASWSRVTNGVVAVGDNYVRTNGSAGAQTFYRLHFP